ncbi:MAG: bifunctional 2-polyprenyl-6-hydroxyphenol methylase/3-demethylubiquinol 3-O-methyltransferase UbiG [Acidobacteriales bacterium]|nr:bifunctional 2-polyprenyl-6-hydroxyphenol methylase/3-demethylubiquinol 3-O-methyltransferase UbiG [Terriglobales bacterium]
MKSPAVNNELYRTLGHCWWDDEVGEFSTIRFFVNPVRFNYFSRVLGRHRIQEPGSPMVLDVGCGGGLLAEEFARAGFQVTGVDPAPESIETARSHAAKSGLHIAYETGLGERLRFEKASFDHVVCCDVLEHVDDVDRVIGEIARVLKPGGLFLYDTVNRTFMSKLAVIKVMQEWPSTAFAGPNSHVWERFIKPAELYRMLERHGLDQREMRGISSCRNLVANWIDFRRRAKGQITFKELGQRLALHESGDVDVSYMGYAVKSASALRK